MTGVTTNFLGFDRSHGEFTRAFQTKLSDVYNVFNLAKVSLSLSAKFSDSISNLSVVFNVILPMLKLVIYSIKSLWDLLTLLANHKHQEKPMLETADNLVDKAVVKLHDGNANRYSLTKRAFLTSAYLTITILAIMVTTISSPLGIASSGLTLLNDLVGFRYNMVAKTAVRRKIAVQEVALETLEAGGDYTAAINIANEVKKLREQEASLVFGNFDKGIKFAISASFILGAAFFLAASPPLAIAAYFIFVGAMAGSLVYNKKIAAKWKNHLLKPVNAKADEKIEALTEAEKVYAKKCVASVKASAAQENTWQKLRSKARCKNKLSLPSFDVKSPALARLAPCA